VLFHHQNLQKFAPSPKVPFKADAVQLDDHFRRVEKVTHQPLTEIYKLAAFLTYFNKDGRPGVAIRIQTMMLMKATYAMTYKSVCDMTAFDDTPHHHALAITKTSELCRKYGLGTCPYADTGRLKRDLPRLPGATFDRSPVSQATFLEKSRIWGVSYGLKVPKFGFGVSSSSSIQNRPKNSKQKTREIIICN
jgi:hypothetical protein